ncbi:hypothetical protein Taro_041019 [Colocasia esculenta]|uniref:Uncharacterized protein n=1 Tax=Colocasia esculenta TaxID=4460 RepID=A0A843WUM4_COLES|nr:hypothetical protein [Colocasia esculenta]
MKGRFAIARGAATHRSSLPSLSPPPASAEAPCLAAAEEECFRPRHRCWGDQSKFEFDVEKEKFVIASISKKWKDHKERLKSRYFKVDGDNPCPLQYLESDQWENLVRHWKSEQGKKLSEVNKKNRAKQQLISTTGPKSIAKRQQDYLLEGIDEERLMKKKLLKSGDEEDVVEEWR